MAQNVKSVCDVVIANVKTVCDVTNANTKTLVGVDNTSGGGGPTVTVVGVNASGNAANGTTLATSATINVTSGDVIIVWGGGASNVDISCAGSPSPGTFTEVRDNWDATNAYKTAVYRLVATSTQANVTFTLTYGSSSLFRSIGAAVFHTSSGTFAFDEASTAGTAGQLQTPNTANRTATNITADVADSLLIGFGLDWDGGGTLTGANGFAVALNNVSFTPFMAWKQVSSTGSYPAGNYGTMSPSDEYFGDFIAFSINP